MRKSRLPGKMFGSSFLSPLVGAWILESPAPAPLLQKYIPGNPSVAVQNVAGAGGIVAGNLFMRETGPELTILQCHIGYPLYQLLGLDIKYDVRRWHFLGGAKRDYMPIMQRAELPYASISEWSQAKNPIVWSADTLGSTVENPARIMRLIGVRMKLVSGYPGGTARLLAVLRGEADATPELLSTAKQHLDEGSLKVVGKLIPGQIPGYPDAPYVLRAFNFTDEQKILYGVAEGALAFADLLAGQKRDAEGRPADAPRRGETGDDIARVRIGDGQVATWR